MPPNAPSASSGSGNGPKLGVQPVNGEPFRFMVTSDRNAEVYLVDIQDCGWTGACNCMHFLVRCAPRIGGGARGPEVRCKHIRRAREVFLETVLPKLARAMGMDEPDITPESVIAAQTTQYARDRLHFLNTHRKCAVFPALNATDIHHSRGRLGPLLLDQRFWIPVSRAGHIWIDTNRDAARQKEWNGVPILCARGHWNVTPERQPWTSKSNSLPNSTST